MFYDVPVGQLVSCSFMFIVNIYNCFSVTDEIPELQAEALKLWDEAGKMYMQENENDLKDQMDFLVDDPVHYPPNGMFHSTRFVLSGGKNNLCVCVCVCMYVCV
jgi:hypothetical protein